jgi:hypothetical protein
MAIPLHYMLRLKGRTHFFEDVDAAFDIMRRYANRAADYGATRFILQWPGTGSALEPRQAQIFSDRLTPHWPRWLEFTGEVHDLNMELGIYLGNLSLMSFTAADNESFTCGDLGIPHIYFDHSANSSYFLPRLLRPHLYREPLPTLAFRPRPIPSMCIYHWIKKNPLRRWLCRVPYGREDEYKDTACFVAKQENYTPSTYLDIVSRGFVPGLYSHARHREAAFLAHHPRR